MIPCDDEWWWLTKSNSDCTQRCRHSSIRSDWPWCQSSSSTRAGSIFQKVNLKKIITVILTAKTTCPQQVPQTWARRAPTSPRQENDAMCGYQRDGFVEGDNFFSDEDEEKNRQENVPCTIFDTTDEDDDEDEDDNDNDDNYYDDKSSTSSDDTDVGNSISRIKRNSRSSRRTPLPTRRGDRGGRVGLRTQVHDHGRKCSVCGQGGHDRQLPGCGGGEPSCRGQQRTQILLNVQQLSAGSRLYRSELKSCSRLHSTGSPSREQKKKSYNNIYICTLHHIPTISRLVL